MLRILANVMLACLALIAGGLCVTFVIWWSREFQEEQRIRTESEALARTIDFRGFKELKPLPSTLTPEPHR